jgi:hypothetical protein
MPLPLLGAFLGTAIGALAKKALTALGLGVVTYAGLQAAFNTAQTQVINNYGNLTGVTLALADMAGVGQSIGIILGAIAGRIGIAVLGRIGRVL